MLQNKGKIRYDDLTRVFEINNVKMNFIFERIEKQKEKRNSIILTKCSLIISFENSTYLKFISTEKNEKLAKFATTTKAFENLMNFFEEKKDLVNKNYNEVIYFIKNLFVNIVNFFFKVNNPSINEEEKGFIIFDKSSGFNCF